MEFGEQPNKEILEILQSLKMCNNLRIKNQSYFPFSIFPMEIDVEDSNSFQRADVIADEKRKILLKLSDIGVLEAIHDDEAVEITHYSYLVKLDERKFEEMYEQMKNKFQTKKSDTKTHLFIDNAGNFWLEPKKILCYPMGVKSERFKILLYLVDNKDFQDTQSIADYLGDKSAQTVRKEIGKIRDNITKYLKIEGSEIIEVKKDSGYRISPSYKVVKV